MIDVARGIAERELHGELEIDSLEGSWFGGLTLHGVQFRRVGDEGPIETIVDGEVEVAYSIAGYLRGEADWLESVAVRAREVRLDLASERESEAATPAEPSRIVRDILLRPPALEIAAARFALRPTADRVVETERLTVTTAEAGARPRYVIGAQRFEMRGAAPGVQPVRLGADLRYDAGLVRIETLRLGETFAIRDGELDLRERDAGRISWTLPLVIGESPGTLDGTLDEERIDARVEMTEASLVDLALFLEPSDAPPPAGRFTLTAHADLPRAEGGEGEIRFETHAVDLVVGDRRFERLDARASLHGDLLRIDELTAHAGENRITVRGLEAPFGAADPLQVLQRGRGDLEFYLPDVPRLAGGERRTELAESFPPHLIELTARLDAGEFELETGRITTSGGTFDVRRGRITLGADPERLVEDGTVDVDFQVAFADLAPLGAILDQDGWGGTLHGDLVLTGSLVAPEGRLVGSARDVAAFGVVVREAEATLLAHDGKITAERFRARTNEWSAEAEGEYDLASGELTAVRVDARCPDLTLLTDGRVAGSATVIATAAGPREEIAGDLVLRALDLRHETLRADEVSLVGRFAGMTVEVEELVVTSEEGRLRAAGSARRAETGDVSLDVTSLDVERDGVRLFLDRPAHVAFTEGRVTADDVALRDEAERLRLELTHRDDVTAATLRLDAFDAGTLLAPFLADAWELSPIDANLELRLGPTERRFDLQLAIARIAAAESELPWSVATRVSFEGTRLKIDEFLATQERLGRVSIRGELPLDPFAPSPPERFPPGELTLTVDGAAAELEQWPRAIWGDRAALAGSATITAKIGGSWREPRGSVRIEGSELVVREARDRGEAIGPLAVHLALLLDEGIRLETGEIRSEELGHVSLHGTIGAPLDIPALLAAGIDPLRDSPLDLRAELDLPDLAWLAARRGEVRRAAGWIGGAVELRGTLREPRPSGRVILGDGELRLTTAFPAMRALAGELVLEEDRLRVERFTGEFGSSPFELTGSVAFGGEEAEIDATLNGSDLLLYRTVDTLVRANARLSVRGPLSRLRAEGEVVLTDGRFARDVNLFAALQGDAAPPSARQRGLDLTIATEPPLSEMVFDIAIRTEEPFVLKNNLIQGALRPDLRLVGTGEVPRLQGRVYIDETRVSLPSGPLYVDSGLLLFDEENPFVPTLELNGRARIRGYSIQARVAGDYDDPEIELSSTPPLANEDLAILFLTGQLPVGSMGERGKGAAQNVAVYVAQDILKRWFSEGGLEDEESILERIEIEFGTDVTKSGAATARIIYLLDDRTRGARRERYLVGERDVWDHINFGYGFRFRFR